MAKVLATDALLKVVDMEMTVWAGRGVTKRFPVERNYRDGKVWAFARGTPQIQRRIVAQQLFKD